MRKMLPLILILAMALPGLAQISFQFEVYGGYSFINPADLNMYSDYYEKWINFYYDKKLEYNENIGAISNLEKEKTGEFVKIKSAIPFGGRIKAILRENLAVSVSMDYFSKTVSSTPSFVYTYTSGMLHFTTSREFSKYELYVKAFNPKLNIHYLIPELTSFAGGILGAELFAGPGLILASCGTHRTYVNLFKWGTGILERKEDDLKKDGSGKGISLNMGGRLNFAFSEKAGVFLAGELIYGKVKNPSGEGYWKWTKYHYIQGSSSAQTSWEGEWYIREFSWSPYWGSFSETYPESSPSNLNEKVRDFELNLSGFRLLFGFFVKF